MTDPEHPVDKKKLRSDRRVSRAFARVAATPDGKVIKAYLEKAIGWDEAGPPVPDENPIHFWTGQRSVVKLIRDHITKGEKLLGNTNDTDEDDEH